MNNMIAKIGNINLKGFNTFRTKDTAVLIISGLFILLFLYAATSKLLDYEKFRAQLGQSPMLTNYSNLLTWFIPAIEIIIILLIIIRRTTLIGFYAAFTLMLMFTVYIAAMLGFADHIPCSCGGILQDMGWFEHLVFNTCFTLLGLAGVLLQKKLNESANVAR